MVFIMSVNTFKIKKDQQYQALELKMNYSPNNIINIITLALSL